MIWIAATVVLAALFVWGWLGEKSEEREWRNFQNDIDEGNWPYGDNNSPFKENNK